MRKFVAMTLALCATIWLYQKDRHCFIDRDSPCRELATAEDFAEAISNGKFALRGRQAVIRPDNWIPRKEEYCPRYMIWFP